VVLGGWRFLLYCIVQGGSQRPFPEKPRVYMIQTQPRRVCIKDGRIGSHTRLSIQPNTFLALCGVDLSTERALSGDTTQCRMTGVTFRNHVRVMGVPTTKAVAGRDFYKVGCLVLPDLQQHLRACFLP